MEQKRFFKGKYWMYTTNDPDWKPELNALVAFFLEQPEQPEAVGWHRQGYVEFKKRLSGKAVSIAFGQPDKPKKVEGEKRFFYRNEPRAGTKEQAMAYCSSHWYCHTCHQGDHMEIHTMKGHTWSYEGRKDDGPYTRVDDGEWACHYPCIQCKEKGKLGPVTIEGQPEIEGRGNHGHCGSGDIAAEILQAITDSNE